MATDIASSPGRIIALNQQTAKPAANTLTGYLYTKSSGGQTELFYENDAGTEEQLSSGAASGVTGTGTANYVSYWTSSTNITGTAGLTYDATTLTHTPTATIASGASATADLNTVAAATVTISGATGITTALGFNIVSIKQATLSAASALAITSASAHYAEAPIGGGAGPATLTNVHSYWGVNKTALTNVTTDVLRLEHTTSGTPAASFGAAILFRGQDASKTAGGDDIARIRTYWTTATSAAEVAALGISVRSAGAALPAVGSDQFIFGPGALTLPAGVVGTPSLNLGTSNTGLYANSGIGFAVGASNIGTFTSSGFKINTGTGYIFYGGQTDAAGIKNVIFGGAPSITAGADRYIAVFCNDTSTTKFGVYSNGELDISAIAAGTANFKITKTNAVPTTTFSAINATNAAPAGFMQVDDAGTPRYIPFYT